MNCDPYRVVRDFEKALCDYTGARFAVTTTSCTSAILLAVAWHLRDINTWLSLTEQKVAKELPEGFSDFHFRMKITIPKRTYISVPMSIIHAGGCPVFRDATWCGAYQLEPFPVWDCARRFTSNMFNDITAGEIKWRDKPYKMGKMQCVSFHWSKILGLGQGGAILHDSPEADRWLRRARFDGRAEGVPPKLDGFHMIGWHCYMAPETAAHGLMRLSLLPEHNDDLPNDDYPDLSAMEIFK